MVKAHPRHHAVVVAATAGRPAAVAAAAWLVGLAVDGPPAQLDGRGAWPVG